MSAVFEVGTKVRLTGEGWDGLDGAPSIGTVVEIVKTPSDVEPGSAGGFLWAHRSGEELTWYVNRTGYWAAELAAPPIRDRKVIEGMLELTREDYQRELESNKGLTFDFGWEAGYRAALEWVLGEELDSESLAG